MGLPGGPQLYWFLFYHGFALTVGGQFLAVAHLWYIKFDLIKAENLPSRWPIKYVHTLMYLPGKALQLIRLYLAPAVKRPTVQDC